MQEKKKQEHIDWDEYFMAVAVLAAKRSKDPSTQVGACIVNQQNKILSTGYNGFPIGCSDDDFPLTQESGFIDTKYAYVCHAELNAILNNPGTIFQNCRIYVSLFPCNECAKAIIQSGIKEVIYLSDKHAQEPYMQASRRMLRAAGVKLTKLQPQHQRLTLVLQEDLI